MLRFTLSLLILYFSPLLWRGAGGEARAQVIDSAFIAQHTYTSLTEALKNPNEVYGLDLRGQNLKELPMEIFQFKNLRLLDLGYKDIDKSGWKKSDEPSNQPFRGSCPHEPPSMSRFGS